MCSFTPRQEQLVDTFEAINYSTIEKMYAQAAGMQGKHYRNPDPEDFGHYLAMESLGHGVSWADDHPAHDFLIPRSEFDLVGNHINAYVSKE